MGNWLVAAGFGALDLWLTCLRLDAGGSCPHLAVCPLPYASRPSTGSLQLQITLFFLTGSPGTVTGSN